MKKAGLALLLLLFLVPAGKAQDLWRLRRYELTGMLGTAHYFGDIGGFSQGENAGGVKDFNIKNTRLMYQLGMKYRLFEEVKLVGTISFGKLKGNDSGGTNELREYQFTSTLVEPMLTGEYYFVTNQNENRFRYQFGGLSVGESLLPSTFYAFTGIGAVIFNVSPNDELAARGNKSSGLALAIPLGLGVEYDFSPYLGMGFRISARFTTSDYLDALSTQWSNARDIYYFAGLTVKYKLSTASNGLPSFRRDRR